MPHSSTHTQYEQVEMCQIRPLQVENMTTIDHETLAYAWKATAARHMRIPTLQKTWDRNKMHYLHVCVFFVTEIPPLEWVPPGQGRAHGQGCARKLSVPCLPCGYTEDFSGLRCQSPSQHELNYAPTTARTTRTTTEQPPKTKGHRLAWLRWGNRDCNSGGAILTTHHLAWAGPCVVFQTSNPMKPRGGTVRLGPKCQAASHYKILLLLEKIKIIISYMFFYKYRKTDRQTQEQSLRINWGTSETILMLHRYFSPPWFTWN